MKSEKEIIEEIDDNFTKVLCDKVIEAIAHGDDGFCYEDICIYPELLDSLEQYIVKNHRENFLLDDAKSIY